MNATYREIPDLLRARAPFQGNSMSAINVDGFYTVYSYSTIIAEVGHTNIVVLNERKYSRTTSRHQNLCRENLS